MNFRAELINGLSCLETKVSCRSRGLRIGVSHRSVDLLVRKLETGGWGRSPGKGLSTVKGCRHMSSRLAKR